MSYYVKGKPWTYKGSVNVEDCRTSEDVMRTAKLDWEVAKCEVVAKMPQISGLNDDRGFVHNGNYYDECPNAYATFRTDYNVPLGIVKERYTPVQNMEAFNFFNDAIGKDKAIWQTAGFFGNGERIFVSAKLPKYISVDGDPVENYLVFTTSHDGSSGVKILFTPIRVICENTLNSAIRTSTNYVSFRHTKSVHSNLDIAAEILGICNNRIDMLNQFYNSIKHISVLDNTAERIFAKIILTEDELFRIDNTGHTIREIINREWRAIHDTEISMKKVNMISEMNNYYYTGVGQKEILGTGWGVLNAVSGYYSNVQNNQGTKRMDSLLYGSSANNIKIATDLLCEATV